MTTLLLFVLATKFVYLALAGDIRVCPSGWFGDTCMYKCHCQTKDTCHKCDSNCEKGWFGPACQFVDLAQSATTPPQPTGTAGDQCSHSALRDFTMQWSTPQSFSWLRLIFKQGVPDSIDDLKIVFRHSQNTNCQNRKMAVVNDTTIDIHCDICQFQQLVLLGAALVDLCRVHISGGRNVALKQPTSQRSNYSDNVCNETCSLSGNAVDGNTDSNLYSRSCTHTDIKEARPWWRLELTHPKVVTKVVLYNRHPHAERLDKFELSMFTKENQAIFNYTETRQGSAPSYTVLTPGIKPVSSARITAAGKILTLCEVEVFGDSVCQHGRFGRDCEHTCNCANQSETCFVSTGGCPSGCADGFVGERCDVACPDRFYGPQCKNSCSDLCVDNKCHHVNGSCHACHVGKQGDDCNRSCDDSFYGVNCTQRCTETCKHQLCDTISGHCRDCPAGRHGDLCQHECAEGTYGDNCSQNCSSRCRHGHCDHTNGTCLSGCLSGFQGDFCDRVVSADPFIMLLIFGGSISGLILILTVSLITCWRCRRMRQMKKDKSLLQDMELTDLNVSMRHKTKHVRVLPEKSSKDSSQSALDHANSAIQYGATAIHMDSFNGYMLTHNKDFLVTQFENIPQNVTATTNVGLSSENRAKNFTRNICAYDHSRVKLKTKTDKKKSDYINASYIQSSSNKSIYIASQAPTKTSVTEFVRMLWEQKVEKVVMLVSEHHEKLEKYWRDDGDIVFGDVRVRLASSQVFADFTVRRLELNKREKPLHIVLQYHFTAWPDKGIPPSLWSLVDFQQRVTSYPSCRPTLVHCTGGVANTGTFIALELILHDIKSTGYMDFYNTIWRLRQDRMHMVQTAEQYIFLHKVVQVAVLCAGTNVQTEDVQDRTSRLDMRTFSGLTYAEKEFTAVCNCIIDGSNYLKGNRKSRVSRYLHQLVDETNLHGRSYTQAPGYKVNLSGQYRKSADNKSVILLPSLTKPNQHMLTPLPVDTPVTNFWTLVLQHRVTVIIAFEPRDSDKQVVSHYLPASKNEVIHCDQMDVEAGTITTGPYWQEHKLTITLRQKKKTKAYDKYHVTHYKYTDDIFNPESVLAFIERVRLGSDQHEKIMFTCLSGAEESGLLYVLTSLLDRLDNDNCINIPLLVGAVKSCHLQVIPTLDYYKVLYKVVNLYVESLLSSSGQLCRAVSTYIQMTSPLYDQRPHETENIYANIQSIYATPTQ